MGLTDRNEIGLEKTPSKALASELNDLLANYQIFYMNVKGFHWNIKGDNFFNLHLQYEQLYSDLLIKIDEIAERILAYGKVPLHSYLNYLEQSELMVVQNISDEEEIAEAIVRGLKKLLTKQRQIVYHAREHDDEGVFNMISTYIKQQEKQLWMYNAYLGK